MFLLIMDLTLVWLRQNGIVDKDGLADANRHGDQGTGSDVLKVVKGLGVAYIDVFYAVATL